MSLGAILLFAQASVPVAEGGAMPPDVELRAHISIASLRIEQDGPITLDLHAQPGATDVHVERSQPAGATSYRNLTIDARVAAYLKQGADGSITPTIESSTGEPPK